MLLALFRLLCLLYGGGRDCFCCCFCLLVGRLFVSVFLFFVEPFEKILVFLRAPYHVRGIKLLLRHKVVPGYLTPREYRPKVRVFEGRIRGTEVAQTLESVSLFVCACVPAWSRGSLESFIREFRKYVFLVLSMMMIIIGC